MSNQAIEYIEIDIPYCSLEYGVAPCQASLTSSPPTGTDKCFNSKITCQDLANIDLQTVTLRFAKAAAYLPRDIDIVAPSVIAVEFSPAVVSLGENLGQRASLKVTFTDHPHSDAGQGFDKYYDERSYNPYQQGTMWAKFRARQPYLRGRAMRWITGFVGQTLAEMETRYFFIESIDGPSGDGKFSIFAKDALKFLDGDRAQAPLPNNGFLVADITAIATAATLSPAGIGNAEYPAVCFANIGGNEIVAVTRTNDSLTLVRGQIGTTAVAHSAQDRVQVCASYTGLDPAVVLQDLLQTYTDLPGAYPDTVTWATETALYFNRLITGLIAEPTPVVKLVSEIIEQCGLAMWDDNVNQKIRMQVLRSIVTDAYLFDDSTIMKPGGLSIAEQPDKRVSQVWVYFGQINPTKRVDDPDNYRSTAVVMDATAEDDYGSPAIRRIFARWIPALGRSTAERLGQIILSRYRDPPRKFTFEVMRRSAVVPSLGGGYNLEWQSLQDALGARETVPLQVTRLLPGAAVIKVDAEEMRFTASDETSDLSNRVMTIDFNTQDFDWKAAHDSVFPAIEPGQTVTLLVADGAIVGSSSASSPAFTVGTWPAGVTLNLTVVGRIEGIGGHGGNGRASGAYGSTAATVGAPGGTALYTRQAINMTDTSGEIWAGGGGGGGGGSGFTIGGGGGGGGGGSSPGVGGQPGSAELQGQPGATGTTEAGGAGGTSQDGLRPGGAGGGPGLAGTAGTGTGFSAAGAAGTAIDGISFITVVGGAGDRRGSQIN